MYLGFASALSILSMRHRFTIVAPACICHSAERRLVDISWNAFGLGLRLWLGLWLGLWLEFLTGPISARACTRK